MIITTTLNLPYITPKPFLKELYVLPLNGAPMAYIIEGYFSQAQPLVAGDSWAQGQLHSNRGSPGPQGAKAFTSRPGLLAIYFGSALVDRVRLAKADVSY